MNESLSDIEKKWPAVDQQSYRALNASLFRALGKTLVIIDDDPTGNQTVYDIPLLTDWSQDVIESEFRKETPVFFILTNSRSLTEQEAYKVFHQVGKHVKKASRETGRDFLIVSRSDSTLRGHYKAELDALNDSIGFEDFITCFIPVMFEGGRVTVNGIHYVTENDTLIPVSHTPFARDASFGYSESMLCKWIEEKTHGSVMHSEVDHLPLAEIRNNHVANLVNAIEAIPSGKAVTVDALNYADLDKVLHAILLVCQLGKKICFRTSSSFIPSFIGQDSRSLLSPQDLNFTSNYGGLIVVGSYVPKSSQQLKYLLDRTPAGEVCELDVEKILDTNTAFDLADFSRTIDNKLSSESKVILYTSRKLVKGTSAESSLKIGARVSSALVEIVRRLENQPKYIIAKGGITSHDLATKALGMKRGVVKGQVLPGIPVWELEGVASNPPYVVFPGNVGQESSLFEITKKLE